MADFTANIRSSASREIANALAIAAMDYDESGMLNTAIHYRELRAAIVNAYESAETDSAHIIYEIR